MTKEELYECYHNHLGIPCIEEQALDKFFDSNVVIPKGANRHPYADVLHQWLEGVDIQVKLDNEWSDYKCSLDYIKAYQYRIKPTEPVYEWQWYRFENNTLIHWTNSYKELSIHYATEDEIDTTVWKKFKETKRLRQCNKLT